MSELFLIQHQLGEGGNGVVFLAEKPSGSLVAIKAIRASGGEANIEAEFLVGTSLHHQNVGRCLSISKTPVVLPEASHLGPCRLLELEYYGGGTLFDMVCSGPLSENVCRFIFN
jgi:serine/threonine protein kinase